MGKNLTRKILESHLAKPSAMNPGDEIYVKVDQTLIYWLLIRMNIVLD